jgi:hypothetical protein
MTSQRPVLLEPAAILLWATRGRRWGFRFLDVPGRAASSAAGGDPLTVYERAFAGHEDASEGCWRADGLVAVRLRDPEQRTDEAGRTIPHEFVLEAARARGVTSPADALARLWPPLAERYAELWDGPGPE